MSTKTRYAQAEDADEAGTLTEIFLSTFSRIGERAILVVPAALIFVAMILLPPYAQLVQIRYNRDCKQAEIADYREQLKALTNFNARYSSGDEVLVKRLAMSQSGLWPDNEIIPASYRRPQPLITIKPTPRPTPPNPWLMQAANRMGNPRTRRGLMLLAIGAFGSVWLLPAKTRR